MDELVLLLKQHHLTISVAESFTCGLFSATLGSIAGVSEVFEGGVVVYTDQSKHALLHIEKDLIHTHGTISEALTYAMAEHVQSVFQTNIGLAFSGNAGPSAIEGKPVGLWYLGICIDQQCEVLTFHESLPRNALREHAVDVACAYCIKRIKELKA